MTERPSPSGDEHLIDLASRSLGGSVLVANDETYAEKENLIKVAAPTFTPATMGPRGQIYDGWETRRRRDEGAGTGREAASSRQEQAGVADDPALRAALAEGNRAYEERFGHVYLVRAAGRTGDEMLALMRERLGNDDATERDVVRAQLAEIISLRLRRLWCEGEV